MIITYEGTIIKIGNSYGITIPAKYFNNGVIKTNTMYRVIIVEEVSPNG